MAEPRVIVLYGEDRYSREEQARAFKAQQRADPAGEHNLDELRAEEVNLPRLLAICASSPFLSDRRVVIVHGLLARALGGRKSEGKTTRKKESSADSVEALQAQLRQGLADLPPTTLLILVEERLDPKRVEPLLPRGATRLMEFPRLEGAELDGWIRKRARSKGLALREDGVRLLARLAEEDLGRIDVELAKLAAYSDGAPAGADEVRLLGTAQDESIFVLLDATTDGRSSDALRSLRALMEQGTRAEGILPQLIALVRRLIVAREGAVQRVRADDLARDLDLNPRTLQRLMPIAGRIVEERLDEAYRRLLEADRAMKTGAQDPEAALELVVGRLCALLRARS